MCMVPDESDSNTMLSVIIRLKNITEVSVVVLSVSTLMTTVKKFFFILPTIFLALITR